MTKLHDIRRSDKEREKEWSPPSRGAKTGISVHLTHEHMQKMGMKPLKAGSNFTMHAKGRVSHSSTEHDESGKPRHSMTLEVTHGKVDQGEEGRSAKDAVDEALANNQDPNIGGNAGSPE